MIRESDRRFENIVLGGCILFEVVIVLILLWGEWQRDGWPSGERRAESREPTQVLPPPAED
jgi:hypothetical protein